MNGKQLLPLLAALAILVSACTQKNTGDEPAASTAPQGLNRFLLFPNPVTMNSGGFETNTTAYATAYYAAVDPSNVKDTIDKWKTANGFTGVESPTEHLAVFRDTKDLGYGRRMTGRSNPDGSVAFFVENYNVAPTPGSGYASVLNVEAAIKRDTRWHVGTNAIEWSSTPCVRIANSFAADIDPPDCVPGVKFAKFYNFSSKDGTRQLAVDLDGNGLKTMPGPCITCHGGRGDPLTPNEGNPGKPRFPLVENSLSRKRGDVQGRLHGMNVDSFGYSPDIPAFSKANQQATLKQFNQWILCTYPLVGASTGPEDICRVPAGPNEWQGTAAEMIKSWYGGTGANGMPSGVFADTYVPTGWQAANVGAPAQDLYKNVIAPYCRTCHILRGTNNQNDLDFTKLGTTTTGFLSYADRIKAHVFDRGTMPLALIVYDAFWSDPVAPSQLANFLNPTLAGLSPARTATDGAGNALKPGRPVAAPGPNRMVKTGANATLSAEDSLFASSFSWTPVSGPATATPPQITNGNSMIATFLATTPGDYVVNLTVGNGSATDSKTVTVTVDDNFPDPATLAFAHVKNIMQNLAPNPCTGCHTVTAVPMASGTPPVWYNTFDRDGSGGAPNVTDDAWFLKGVDGRVNLTEIEASPLLRKPSGNHHNGGTLFNVTTAAGLRNYSIFYNWILAGMPAGGIAANPVINGGTTPAAVTFAGSPLGAAFSLAGGTSIGATTFQWSLVPPITNGPAGTPPSIANPTSANATLNVFNVGTYTVELKITDGGSLTDIAQRTIVVTENPITAVFTPGDLSSIFAGATTLTPDAVGTNGNPTTCRWQILSGPAGATIDGIGTDVTKPCTFVFIFLGTPFTLDNTATLNVPASVAVGSQYQVSLTASNIGPASVTHTFTVANSVPSANLGNTASPVTRTFASTGTNLSIPTSATTAGPVNGSVLVPIVGANITLDGGLSTTPTGTLSYFWCINGALPDANFPASGIAACPSETSSGTTSSLTVNVRATGNYSVRLRVDNGVASSTVFKTVLVRPTNNFTFAGVTGIIPGGCASTCHVFGAGVANAFNPQAGGDIPPWDNANTKDGATIYMRLRQRVFQGSLPNCPQNGCPGMGAQPNFAAGQADLINLNFWIGAGAPPGN